MKLTTTIIGIFAACSLLGAQNVYYLGDVDNGLKKSLKKDNYKATKLLEDADLVVVSGSTPVAPDKRSDLNALFAEGTANLLFLGERAFDYSPKPADARRIIDFSGRKGWEVVNEKREKKARFTEMPAVSLINDPWGSPAVELKTLKDCTKDCFIKVCFPTPLPEDRNVLTFRAKGNEWMDVLSLEARDNLGKVWVAFVPITTEWAEYALTFADFLPQGRQKDENYIPLTPSRVTELMIGTNIQVIWYEQPTYLGLSEVSLAKNLAPYTVPESNLQKVQIAFEKRATAIPEDLYDPAWRAKNPWDVIRNDADTKIGNYSKKDRESRIVRLNSGTVEFFPEGVRKGGAVALFPEWKAEYTSDVLRAAELMTRTPLAVSTRMNMKDGRAQLTVWLRNPLPTEVRTSMDINIGGVLKDNSKNTLPGNSVTAKVRILDPLPENFPLTKFDWSVNVGSKSASNTLGGTIDLERAFIKACQYLVKNQRTLPDGRISNHYFGDAYGVRAMLILVHQARKDPSIVERNADLLASIGIDDIEAAAFRWLDMMCDRQHPDGLMYLGYGEPRATSNVADMGEITTCVFQALQYISDPVRKERYSEAFENGVKWMENFYIDTEEKSAEVRENWASYLTAKGKEDQIGRYGLGMLGARRRTYGPIWVNELIMPVHCILAFYGNEEQKAFFRPIFDRNSDYMMTQKYTSTHYYHAESTFWHWYVTPDPERKALLQDNMTRTMLPRRFAGDPMEPYDRGGRSAMNAMPLLYYQRFIQDSPEIRAVLLKYLWAFAETGSYHAIDRLSEAFPKATHGEGIAASKFAGHSAIWAAEALWPGCTLLF